MMRSVQLSGLSAEDDELLATMREGVQAKLKKHGRSSFIARAKGPTFAGLTNQGATCYMNSLL